MLKKELNFIDYNGRPQTVEAHFEIDEAELAELETSFPGGFTEALASFMQSPSTESTYKIFSAIVRAGYCKINADGTLDRSEETFKKFRSSKAYNTLFCEIISSKDAAANFFTSMVDTPVLDRLAKESEKKDADTGNNS